MSDEVFERYREALRRGHVAALRGRLDLAIDAYAEAATLAPERPVPHVSLGDVLVRLGRLDDGLAAYDRALERSPRDETALNGRAAALVAGGRRAEAARTLDLLSQVQDGARRLADAADSARSALEQAESRDRRRHLTDLVARLREVGGPGAEAALARASEVLEARKPAGAGPAGTPGKAEDAEGSGRDGQAGKEVQPPSPPGSILVTEALASLDAGDPAAALAGLLSAARALAAARQSDAALDACYLALSFAPDDPEVHLALIDLYLARGWRGQAADKLVLLRRLVELTDDAAAKERVAAVAIFFPEDMRLAASPSA